MQNIQLIATNPQEMVLAQQNLLVHCETLAKEKTDLAVELRQNFDIAKKNKWNTKGIKKAYDVALKTAIYYNKIKSAVKAGYYIVPNMPIDVFAVRVKKRNPTGRTIRTYENANQSAQLLAEGEGRYVSDAPLGQHTTRKDTTNGRDLEYFTITDYDDISFPVTLVRPQVMDATAQAVALKIFDQIGIAPQTRKGDPMIIGQILKPGTSDWNVYGRKKAVSFLIAWFLDTDVL
jgi:hypothetical protein